MKRSVTLRIFAAFMATIFASSLCHSQETKAEQSKVEKKIDSHLLRAIKGTYNQNHLLKSEDGRYLMDVSGAISKDLLSLIQGYRGEVVSSSEAAKTARVKMPLEEVSKLAADDRVKFISPAVPAALNPKQSPGTEK